MERIKIIEGTPLFSVHRVTRRYTWGDLSQLALKEVDLTVHTGEFLALAGSSGSGKTTLLNLLGLLDRPDSGDVQFFGGATAAMTSRQQSELRAQKIGFVFQTFNLIPTLSALENVEYPLLLLGTATKERRAAALQWLTRVGLKEFAHKRPSQLSGGQRQRVAIARALVKQPQVLLADEPTASLDRPNAREVMGLLQTLNQELGVTIIFSSHDELALSFAKRTVHLQDGQIEQKRTEFSRVA